MVGLIVGIGSLIGLTTVLRRTRCHRHCHRHRHHARCGGRGHGRWRRGPLWRLLDRLDTTPGQEKVIREEVDRLVDQAHMLKQAWWRTGDDLAQVMGGESADEAAIDAALARGGAAAEELRKELARSLARIHEVLDAPQRRRLARLLSAGPWPAAPWGGPYRR